LNSATISGLSFTLMYRQKTPIAAGAGARSDETSERMRNEDEALARHRLSLGWYLVLKSSAGRSNGDVAGTRHPLMFNDRPPFRASHPRARPRRPRS